MLNFILTTVKLTQEAILLKYKHMKKGNFTTNEKILL